MGNVKNIVIQEVYTILDPLIGHFMAKSILTTYGKKYGFTDETIDYIHLPKIAEELQRGLAAFIGKEAANVLATKVKNI